MNCAANYLLAHFGRETLKSKLAFSIILLSAAVQAFAQRSTPVTIAPTGNTIKIDPSSSTVKMDTTFNFFKLDPVWNSVKLDPANNAVKIDSTFNTVKIDPTNSSVKIDTSSNTIKVDPSNNTVKIDPANNTVSQRYQKIQPWTSTQIVTPNSNIVSAQIDLRGFREMRLWLQASVSASITVAIEYSNGDGTSFQPIGYFDLGTPNQLSTLPNYHASAGNFFFSLPVASDAAIIYISNGSPSNITVSKWSVVYLVN